MRPATTSSPLNSVRSSLVAVAIALTALPQVTEPGWQVDVSCAFVIGVSTRMA